MYTTRRWRGYFCILPRKPPNIKIRTMGRRYRKGRRPLLAPAMAAGVTDRLWEMGDIVEVLEAWEAAYTS